MTAEQDRLALELELLELEAFAASGYKTFATSLPRGLAVKSAPAGATYDIEGLGAPYGGPLNGNDLTGERFTKSTNFCLDFFQSWPLCFEHGMDPDVGTTVVGRVSSWKSTPEGLWVQAQLDRSNKYWKAIQQLVDQGKLFFSSGSMPHMVEKKTNGEITRWPICEMTLTCRPANPLAVLSPAQAQKHFAAAGLSMASRRSRSEFARDLDLIELEAFAAGLGGLVA